MISGPAIRKKRKEMNLSVKDLAEALKVKPDNLYKWEKGTKPTDPEDYMKIENWLSGKLESVPHETNADSEKEPTPLQLMKIIITTNESIRKDHSELIQLHKDIVATNAKLADTNNELAKKIPDRPIEGAPQQNVQELNAIRAAVVEFLIEVASGKRFRNQQEAGQAYSKKVAELMGLVSEKDIQKHLYTLYNMK